MQHEGPRALRSAELTRSGSHTHSLRPSPRGPVVVRLGLSGWLGHNGPALFACPPRLLLLLGCRGRPAAKRDSSRMLTQELGGADLGAQSWRWSLHPPPPSPLSQQPLLHGRGQEPAESQSASGRRPMYRARQAGSSAPGRAALSSPRRPLLAGQLAVEAGQGNGEGLQRTQRVVVVHGEHILSHAAKLHHDVVRWSRAWTDTGHQRQRK